MLCGVPHYSLHGNTGMMMMMMMMMII